MKLTLRKARKLEGQIHSFIVALQAQMRLSGQININLGDTEAQMNALRDDYIQKRGLVVLLTTIRYNIREKIGEANAQSGLNRLLTEKEALEAVRKLYVQVTPAHVRYAPEVLAARVDQAKRVYEDPQQQRYGAASDTIQVTFLTEEDIRDNADREAEQRRIIADIEDQLLAINNGTTIEISDEFAGILRDHRIL